MIKRGKELKLFTVLRYFLLDSMAYENIRQQQHAVKPDYIEVLPGVMPKVIGKVCKMSKTPIIAGGLISDKESVMAALSAGAIAVSSTNHEVWKLSGIEYPLYYKTCKAAIFIKGGKRVWLSM